MEIWNLCFPKRKEEKRGGEGKEGIQRPPWLDVLSAQVASELPCVCANVNSPSPSRHSPKSIHSPASPELKKRET